MTPSFPPPVLGGQTSQTLQMKKRTSSHFHFPFFVLSGQAVSGGEGVYFRPFFRPS
jgi:hypothetical protein